MNKLKYLFYKDFLLLIRDVAGLLLMFLMPVILVVLMTLLQDSTLNVVKDTHVPLLLVNNDKGELGKIIEEEITRTGIFDVTGLVKGRKPGLEELEKEVASSHYMMGIYIPENTTESIRANVAEYVLAAFSGEEEMPPIKKVDLTVFIDPTTKTSFFTAVTSTLQEKAQKVQFEFILSQMTEQVNNMSPIPFNTKGFTGDQVNIEIRNARLEGKDIVPNSVQHNVPAWSLFAIFFIVVSLAGSIIREREGGSFSRLLTMPCSYTEYLLSKALVFTLVALIQFAIMLLMGMYVLPYFGLESLNPGTSFPALFILALSCAFAAIGYGIAIGNLARTDQQSSVFGAISVVIMAAVGGVWVPSFLMSDVMKNISLLSPMHWGLSGFYDIFLRDAGVVAILPESAALFGFGAVCFALAVGYNHKYRIDI